MIYTNDDPMAIFAMELDRTDGYGAVRGGFGGYEREKCPVCGDSDPEHYYMNEDEECVGCSECLYKTDVLF